MASRGILRPADELGAEPDGYTDILRRRGPLDEALAAVYRTMPGVTTETAHRLMARDLLLMCASPMHPMPPEGDDEGDDDAGRIIAGISRSILPVMLLTGRSFIGKTMTMRILAWRTMHGDRVPAFLEGRRVWTLSPESSTAGSDAAYAWSTLLKGLIDALPDVIIHGGCAAEAAFMTPSVPTATPVIMEASTDTKTGSDFASSIALIVGDGRHAGELELKPRHNVILSSSIIKAHLDVVGGFFRDRFGYVPSPTVVEETCRAHAVIDDHESWSPRAVINDVISIVSDLHSGTGVHGLRSRDGRASRATVDDWFVHGGIIEDDGDIRAAVRIRDHVDASGPPAGSESTGPVLVPRGGVISLTPCPSIISAAPGPGGLLLRATERTAVTISSKGGGSGDAHDGSPVPPPPRPSAPCSPAVSVTLMPEREPDVDPMTFRDRESLERAVRADVIGQDAAITRVLAPIVRRHAGLIEPTRPVASLLLVGPSGVGKTETAKSMADHVFGSGGKLIRIDCSELYDTHMLAALIGSPQGYVGYGDGGRLTNWAWRNPNGVILFDEVEKAGPAVVDSLLLPLLDAGRITGSTMTGRDRRGDPVVKSMTVDCTGHVVIMTSNLGSESVRADSITRTGFGSGSDDGDVLTEDVLAAVRKRFRPEVVNRFDDVIVYQPLGRDARRAIFEHMWDRERRRLHDRGMDVVMDDEVRDWFAERTGDRRYGARPLRRLIDARVVDPIADVVLRDGRIPLRVSVVNGEILVRPR